MIVQKFIVVVSAATAVSCDSTEIYPRNYLPDTLVYFDYSVFYREEEEDPDEGAKCFFKIIQSRL